MAIRKYFESFIFCLISCFSYFVTISCTEIRKDKRLSIWDDSDDWWNKYQTPKDPFDWDRDRWDRLFTLAPLPEIPREDDDFLHKNYDNAGIYYAVFVIVFVLLAALSACLKYYCEENTRIARVGAYNRVTTIHPPPDTPPRRSSLPTIARNVAPERLHIILDINSLATETSTRANAADRPPRYDEVVIADLSGEAKFVEVQPAIPETPPPEYGEDNVPRF